MNTGSAMRRLEAITGLKVTHPGEGLYRLDFEDGGAMVVFIEDEKKACNQLEHDNWALVCQKVFDACGWKCHRCNRRRPLQGHHKIYRSRWRRQDGPRDVASNVEALCADCHEKEHRPSPRIQGDYMPDNQKTHATSETKVVEGPMTMDEAVAQAESNYAAARERTPSESLSYLDKLIAEGDSE